MTKQIDLETIRTRGWPLSMNEVRALIDEIDRLQKHNSMLLEREQLACIVIAESGTWKQKARTLERENAKLRALLVDVDDDLAVAWQDERISYVECQLSPGVLKELRALVDGWRCAKCEKICAPDGCCEMSDGRWACSAECWEALADDKS